MQPNRTSPSRKLMLPYNGNFGFGQACARESAAPANTHLPPDSRWEHRLAPGTCGELVQGATDDGDFLVNCPIDLYSRATVRAVSSAGLQLENQEEHQKVAAALAIAARTHGIPVRHEASVASDIPRGKGMASSTADISAALDAFSRCSGIDLPPATFAAILATVEPSDCVHFEGIAHVNHLTGQLHESLPPPDGLRVVVVDCGGEVDTMAFDRDRARAVYRANRPTILAALNLLKRGLRGNDPLMVAEAATQSAVLSQQILPKPQLDRLLPLVRTVGALGVNCAHSGTVLGVIYRESEALGAALSEAIDKAFGRDLDLIGDFAIVGGGCRGART